MRASLIAFLCVAFLALFALRPATMTSSLAVADTESANSELRLHASIKPSAAVELVQATDDLSGASSLHRILVTGAAGFIGFHLSAALASSGSANVTALDSFSDFYSIALKRERARLLRVKHGISVINGDVCDADLLERTLVDNAIQTVVHLAAQPGVRFDNAQAYVRNNIECFVTLLETLRKHPQIRLVFASSSSVYGSRPSGSRPAFSESDVVDSPSSLYAVTKLANEQLAQVYFRLHGVCSSALRFFSVYGEWGRPDMAAFSFMVSKCALCFVAQLSNRSVFLCRILLPRIVQ